MSEAALDDTGLFSERGEREQRESAPTGRRMTVSGRIGMAWEVVTGSLIELWAHKLRSILTLTLLMLGVFALVVMTSVLDGVMDKVTTGFSGMSWDGTVLRRRSSSGVMPRPIPICRFIICAYSEVTPLMNILSVPPRIRTLERFVARGRKARTLG